MGQMAAEGWPMPGELEDYYQRLWEFQAKKDPLTLDLDNDGIETVGIDPANPIHFDHNADGIKTATGWIKGDDGLVVLDRNGNGAIDSGRELFGDNTKLANGELAANGFAALADLDANGDGKLDASDAAFTNLRVWQDTNQDGVSQATELKTLVELGITSIATIGTQTDVNLGNGNTQPLGATYTKANGSTGVAGTVEMASGSLNLASNNFYREFTDNPTLSEAAKALPQMGGSGAVRDLREAMSLGGTQPNAQADALLTKVQAFAAGTTREAQQAVLADLVYAWGATSGQADALARTGNAQPGTDSAAGAIALYAQNNPSAYAKITALERFNGDTIMEQLVQATSHVRWDAQANKHIYWTTYAVTVGDERGSFLDQAWTALSDSVYDALAMQTRLEPYLDKIALVIDENGIRFDTSEMLAAIDAAHQADGMGGLGDAADLYRLTSQFLANVGAEDGVANRVETWLDTALASTLQSTKDSLTALNTKSGESPAGSTRSDIVVGSATGDLTHASDGNDIVFGKGANDVVYGDAGDDALKGGAGHDTLIGGTGDDVLDGGLGDDNLLGNEGNDTYLFGRGDGRDHFVDVDSTEGNVDTVIFRSGIAPADVRVARGADSTNMMLHIKGGSDRPVVIDFFGGEGTGGAQIEQFRFLDDPTAVWGVKDMLKMALTGAEGEDYIEGYQSDDALSGLDGPDTLMGRGGNDTLDGGAGSDVLKGEAGADLILGGAGVDTAYGGDGNDTLDGGTGDDNLNGGAGSDTYVFKRGDGRDHFIEADATAGSVDTVLFKSGISPADVRVEREVGGNALLLHVAGGTDRPAVIDYFASEATTGAAIEAIRFEDSPSTVWTVADVKQMAITGGSAGDELVGYSTGDRMSGNGGADWLHGRAGDDSLSGGAGDDWQFGETGNDTLDGGAGDDVLDGGAGGDTYVFARGDGRDHFRESTSNSGDIDKIVFKAGIAPSDVRVVREPGSNTLALYIAGGNDRPVLIDFFANPANEFEEVRFEDSPSTVWTAADLKQMATVLTGTAAGESLQGTTQADVLRGLGGDDYLYGQDGNDTLDGGTGDDYLAGGVGSDTYVFARGDGRDHFVETASNSGDVDVFMFKSGIAPADVTVTREVGGNALLLNVAGGNDRPALINFFAGAANETEEIRFEDSPSTVWTAADLKQMVSGGQVLKGTDSADTLDGASGPDRLLGQAGNDWLNGQTGDDTIDGGAGNDRLVGGYLSPGYSLSDMAGSDTYLFGRGDGVDTVYERDSSSGSVDKIVFKPGVAPNDVNVSRSDNYLVLSIKGTSDVIRVDEHFGNKASQIEEIRFSDSPNTVWTGTEIAEFLTVAIGTASAETLNGAATHDKLFGLGGDDYLYGQGGNDTLDGGTGDDYLAGGVGSDTYVFARGDGRDHFVETASNSGDVDVFLFKSGIAPTDVTVERQSGGNALLLYVAGGNDRPAIIDFFADTARELEEVRFEDSPSTVWSAADLKQMVSGGRVIVGTDASETLDGSSGPDRLLGQAGNDWLNGQAGDDTIDGGAGNDRLVGGYLSSGYSLSDMPGSDTYLFGRGDGVDTVYERDSSSGSVDKIVFKTGVTPSDVRVSNSSGYLMLSITGTSDVIRVDEHFNSASARIEEVRFTDSPTTVWTQVDLVGMAQG